MDIIINMEYIIVLIICALCIIICKFALNIKFKDLKEIKRIGYDKNLNDITNNLPENEQVCKEILKKLKNEDAVIESNSGENNKSSLYIVISNKIIIANIKDSFTRIQTIAHECVHSVQNKRTLMFNFVFSNIYILYFIVISILTLLHVITMPKLYMYILTIFGVIYYVVRNNLEMDAMQKAPYIAKKYIEDSKQLSQNQIDTVIDNYEYLNKMGIPMTSFNLIASVIIKIMIYCLIAIISTI